MPAIGERELAILILHNEDAEAAAPSRPRCLRSQSWNSTTRRSGGRAPAPRRTYSLPSKDYMVHALELWRELALAEFEISDARS
jgi:hypothetical protein